MREQRFETTKTSNSKRERIKIAAGKSVSEADVVEIEARKGKRKTPDLKQSSAPKKKIISYGNDEIPEAQSPVESHFLATQSFWPVKVELFEVKEELSFSTPPLSTSNGNNHCNTCGKLFQSKKNLDRHAKTHKKGKENSAPRNVKKIAGVKQEIID